METLGLSLGYLLIQILNLILVVGLPLGLALLVYRWMTQVTHQLEDLHRALDEVGDRLDALADYLAQREGR